MSGFFPGLRRCAVAGGLVLAARTALGDGAALAVTVSGAGHGPVADAVVMVTGAGGHAGPAARAIMDQSDRRFRPYVLSVNTGATVDFPNNDTVRHHVYSFSPARPFEIKLYPQGESRSVHFDSPGVAAVGCNIHDWMRAYVVVTDAPLHGVTDADGVLRFDGLAPGAYQVAAWYPGLGRYLDAAVTGEVDVAGDGTLASIRLEGDARPIPPPGNRPLHGGDY